MKKIFTLIISINIIGMMIGFESEAKEISITNNLIEKDRLEMIKEKGVLTVVAPSKETPFFSINPKTNEISGIDSDIINEITKRLGINKIEVKEEQFSNLLEKFNSDDSVDISFGGMFITPESEKLVDFTNPLYKETEAIIVPKLSTLNFISDLKNSVVGVEEGTIFKKLSEKWKENHLIKDILILNSTTELFNALNNRKIDAALADSIIIDYHLIKEKDPTLRILKGYTPELQGVIGIAVKKNDTSLLNELNKIIDDMKSDGTLYAILVKNGLGKNNMIGN
ncbi:ABC transporter substrate-binding protein [Clostridium sp. SHJSY1]|uniref:ABC transporter substrate-binding protein n=1 Tax=Clostridium sp. SHJSY1 TaxID=2942483 RepID=UPI002875EA16|nr:ABC transporter substrate-binding protein [Clostridium sp. SHJSY1]MDS0528508.1 ABC transporter substrate-binding protein [Clostridium sp. SHJSY1]